MNKFVSVGIDLGTTYSCAFFTNESKQLEVVKDQFGNRTTPTVICFTRNGLQFGQAALNQKKQYPLGFVSDVKRFLGIEFNKVHEHDKRSVPYLRAGSEGLCEIGVQEYDDGKPAVVWYKPEQLSGFFLDFMRSNIEQSTGAPVSHAVVTHPAYFNQKQRELTIRAAKLARFRKNVNLETLTEPTAAAICEANKRHVNGNILVFDFGGGTFDCSILNASEDEEDIGRRSYRTVAVHGNPHLGGEDITAAISKWVTDQYKNTEKGKQLDFSSEKGLKIATLIQEQSDLAKKSLSAGSTSTEIHIKGEMFVLSMDLFDAINKPNFEKTMDCVQEAIKKADLKEEIKLVIMVGGSTKIPYIKKMLQRKFGDIVLFGDVDESIAMGAALKASWLCEQNHQNRTFDVTPLSIGVSSWSPEKQLMVFVEIIECGLQYPTSKKRELFTRFRNQEKVQIKIYEGEFSDPLRNHYLGTVTIENIPLPNNPGTPIDIAFGLDCNGILTVEASCSIMGSDHRSEQLEITRDKMLSKEEWEQMKLCAEQHGQPRYQDEEINLLHSSEDDEPSRKKQKTTD